MARPKEFEDAVVLEAALQCFWGRGYEATSIRDLIEAMGISTPSLYNAFGDKRELYVETLEHYCRTRTHPLLERLESKQAGLAAIVALFEEVVERSLADRERRGCFLVNTALEVAPHDRMMAKVVAAHLDAVRSFFLRQLETAEATREIDIATTSRGAADHLLSVLLGVRVLARSRPERELLQRSVGTALVSAGAPLHKLGKFRAATRR